MNSTAAAESGIPLETISVFTALGIQFWDAALDIPVTDALDVAAQPQDTAYRPVSAFRTASGVYAFQGLPGLHSIEYPQADSNLFGSPPTALPFVLSVADTLHRFVPTLFAVHLPLGYAGLFLSNDSTSPPGVGARAYLFSAPTRPIGPGIAAICGQTGHAQDLRRSSHSVLLGQLQVGWLGRSSHQHEL